MASFVIRDLLEAGFHFGHPVSRWNPKMKPYIFGKRNLIHLIDLRETVRGLVIARKFAEAICSEGKSILFVGTKNQARNSVRNQALRSGMHYVNERWLGGTLTNFRTIRSRLSRLDELEELEKTGQMEQFSKKMIAMLTREKEKIQRNLEGIRNMERLPGVLVIIDPHKEKNAVAEANKLKIPIVALTDTDCDPAPIDVVVPGNDDAMRAIEIVCNTIADAALAGKAKASAMPAEPAKPLTAEEPAEKTEGKPGPRGRQRRQRRQRPEAEERVRVRRRIAVPQPGQEEAKAPTEGDQAESADAPAEAKPEQPPTETEAKPEPAAPEQEQQSTENQGTTPVEAEQPAPPAEAEQKNAPQAEEQEKSDS
ncbi:MAG: 30S ribosomal protein S2 [Planctomycetes bacterium]|nr:30S ribosomal protein S2 [Planctomycetota bacterium]